jgi:hypothetical protein
MLFLPLILRFVFGQQTVVSVVRSISSSSSSSATSSSDSSAAAAPTNFRVKIRDELLQKFLTLPAAADKEGQV